MSHSVHTATTQSYDLASSLLNTPFAPATEPRASRNPRNRAKKYPCTWQGCNRFFDCPHNVQQHIREAHTGEKPYECEICAAEGVFSAFSRQYGLNRHKRQVHFIGIQSSRAVSSSNAGDPVAAAGLQQTDQSQIVENDEFEAILAQAGFDMGADSSDVQVFDGQFVFDAEPSDMDISGAQHSGGLSLACDDCGYTSATERDIFRHMHAAHNIPNTRFCTCDICTMMFKPSREDALNHTIIIRNGAFHVPSDTSFAQDGPNVTMAPAWSSQPGPGGAIGWDAIDPALLSFSGARSALSQ
jgi:hypothetical protein